MSRFALASVKASPGVTTLCQALALSWPENRAVAAYHYAARDVRYGRPREYSNDWAIRPLGAVAEEQGHHPDILLSWGKAEITLWTHKIDGLTESDFIMAAKIDRLLGR